VARSSAGLDLCCDSVAGDDSGWGSVVDMMEGRKGGLRVGCTSNSLGRGYGRNSAEIPWWPSMLAHKLGEYPGVSGIVRADVSFWDFHTSIFSTNTT
jgi:hypothetical protein